MPLDMTLEAAQDAAAEARARPDGAAPFVWIRLHAPTAGELGAVASKFDIHPLAVEDALQAHQRPRLRTYGETIFVVLKTVRYGDREEIVSVGELMLFIGSNFVVSVRHGAGSPLSEVRNRLEAQPERLRAGPAVVLHAVIDRVVDDYIVAAGMVDEDIDDIESDVFSGDRNDHAERIHMLKREVLAFQRSVKPLAEPLRRLADGEFPQLDDMTVHYCGDVYDNLLRAGDQIDEFSQLLNSALEANTAGVAMRQNEDMRKIASWVAILGWITMIAGVYGMNFEHMPELNWKLGYPMAVGVMLGGSAVLYSLFKRNSWL